MKTSTDKRTHLLKAILEQKIGSPGPVLLKPQGTKPQDINNGASPLAEHTLLNATVAIAQSPQHHKSPQNLRASFDALTALLKKEIAKSAAALELDETELEAWIDLQPGVPNTVILNFLRTQRHLQLDPLKGEMGFIQYEDGRWQPFLTIEGCCKLLNQHPQFNGLVFAQSNELVNGIPEWIECTIYRRDRTIPTTVREYYVEVKSDTAPWKKMPCRMLRHRALQQCTRLVIA